MIVISLFLFAVVVGTIYGVRRSEDVADVFAALIGRNDSVDLANHALVPNSEASSEYENVDIPTSRPDSGGS